MMTASSLSLLTQTPGRRLLLDRITEEVRAVEEELKDQVRSNVEMVRNVSRWTLDAGGKRLRPAFVGLAARATDRPYDLVRARKLGACMELIHMATLIHDDVIDNSATRRGRSTAGAEFGATAAILTGDVLLARAMVVLAQDGDTRLIETVSDAVVSVVEGEVRELEVRGDFDLSVESHMEVLELKTAALIECCCEMGAIVADADDSTRRALKTYGRHVGIAFQIVDDLLDYRGDQSSTGKPRATDFREGQATLPLIFLRSALSDSEAKIVRRKFGSNPNEDEIRLLADWMDVRGAYAQAEAVAREHVDRALVAIADLPSSEARDLLEGVADYVMSRSA